MVANIALSNDVIECYVFLLNYQCVKFDNIC